MKKILLLFCLLLISSSLFARDRVYTSFLNGAAIRGYDPVAYFTESKPVKGDKKYSYEWRSAKWLFASEENLELFKEDPNKYAPQYGGFCAYAMAQGQFAVTVPEAWSIIDDKLYLNFNLAVRERWEKNKQQYIELGDENWFAIWKGYANL